MPLYQPENLYAPILSQFSLKGKIAVVTGGSRGIGAEVVRGLAEAGADVAFIYKTNAKADETAARIEKEKGFGGGRIDIAVANAGVCANVKSLEYTERTWQDMNSVNYDGVMWTAQAVGNIFKKQGEETWSSPVGITSITVGIYSGVVVAPCAAQPRGDFQSDITASVSAILVNVPQVQAAYNASKAAVVQLAKSLFVEWADFARVNCVSPGYILTESQLWFSPQSPIFVLTKQPRELMEHWLSMIPGGRVCHPAELTGLYVFLASDACCYMTGSNVVIDGGYTLP
ncbi:short-chain dehydrogenase [Colletotrichum salicis]|uniref:Short-chain dehydrogenase n=1 Tax=Colletotrichum salicis TaxID=1209931 RepID=A0A135V7U2_9PEZI|nr:short-chain dehydrogenase [Colletotrichum salicis]